jgi:hypothetical protein
MSKLTRHSRFRLCNTCEHLPYLAHAYANISHALSPCCDFNQHCIYVYGIEDFSRSVTTNIVSGRYTLFVDWMNCWSWILWQNKSWQRAKGLGSLLRQSKEKRSEGWRGLKRIQEITVWSEHFVRLNYEQYEQKCLPIGAATESA